MVKLTIKQSEGKGLGVFACESIKKLQPICLFPARLMGPEEPDDGYCMNFGAGKRYTGDPITVEGPVTGLAVAHMVNDVACPTKREFWPGMAQWKRDVEEYSKSMYSVNSVVFPNTMELVATRDIKAGEEVLTFYGADHWLHHLYGRDVYQSVKYVETRDIDEVYSGHSIDHYIGFGVLNERQRGEYMVYLHFCRHYLKVGGKHRDFFSHALKKLSEAGSRTKEKMDALMPLVDMVRQLGFTGDKLRRHARDL